MRRITLMAAGFCVALAGLASATEIIVNDGDGQDCHITLNSGSTVTTDPTTGNLTAAGSLGAGCPTGVSTPLQFTAGLTGPTSAAPGTGLNLAWAATGPAGTTCTTTGTTFPGGAIVTNWPTSGDTSIPLSGPRTVTLPAVTTGLFTFAMSCNYPGNPGAAITSSLAVDVTNGGGPDCTGVAPSPSPGRQTSGQWFLNTVNQGVTNFADYLYPFSDKGASGSTPWPGTIPGGARTLMIGASSYVALQFTTGNTPVGTFGSYRMAQSAFSPAPFYVTITECPGDFRTASIDDKCEMGPTGKGELYWLMGGSSAFRCVLESNKTYYLNMVSADPSNLQASFCTAASCGILISPSF